MHHWSHGAMGGKIYVMESVNGTDININTTGIITAATFSGSGASLTSIPYTSLTGITTEIAGDTTPQLGGNLDLNSNDITGTGNVGVGTTNPTSAVVAGNTSVVHAGIVTANFYYGDGSNLTFLQLEILRHLPLDQLQVELLQLVLLHYQKLVL